MGPEISPTHCQCPFFRFVNCFFLFQILSLFFFSSVVQKDLNRNLACIELFSANAMDVFITTFQKLGEYLLRPWRQGQPLNSGPPLVMVSMVTPLLALVKNLLTELLSSGKYQFKDTRLLKALMMIHTVMCTAPMTGQLSSLAYKVGLGFWETTHLPLP